LKEIERIIENSLVDFLKKIKKNKWVGRENEAINFFAFSNLIKRFNKSNVILRDPAQIGIEVAVPQLRGKGKKEVRKDLVIWNKPGMTNWNKCGQPIVIMEWKFRAFPKQRKKSSSYDIHWLKSFSRKNFIGYSVNIDIVKNETKIVKVCEGEDEDITKQIKGTGLIKDERRT
jgi:hypothetical protein